MVAFRCILIALFILCLPRYLYHFFIFWSFVCDRASVIAIFTLLQIGLFFFSFFCKWWWWCWVTLRRQCSFSQSSASGAHRHTLSLPWWRQGNYFHKHLSSVDVTVVALVREYFLSIHDLTAAKLWRRAPVVGGGKGGSRNGSSAHWDNQPQQQQHVHADTLNSIQWEQMCPVCS